MILIDCDVMLAPRWSRARGRLNVTLTFEVLFLCSGITASVGGETGVRTVGCEC